MLWAAAPSAMPYARGSEDVVSHFRYVPRSVLPSFSSVVRGGCDSLTMSVTESSASAAVFGEA